jgi:hypothetical protein
LTAGDRLGAAPGVLVLRSSSWCFARRSGAAPVVLVLRPSFWCFARRSSFFVLRSWAFARVLGSIFDASREDATNANAERRTQNEERRTKSDSRKNDGR